jgi:hypothetical protein
VGLKKESACDVVEGVDGSLGFAILRRSVRARHAEVNPVAGKKFDEGRVDELSSIIRLDGNYGKVELVRAYATKLMRMSAVSDLCLRGNVHIK